MSATPISLHTGWLGLFGPQRAPLPTTERRRRWAEWLRLARKSDRPETAMFWAREHECHDCLHRRGGWFRLQQLPCTVNPVLTFRTDDPGMACMGLGRERIKPEQIDLFEALDRFTT